MVSTEYVATLTNYVHFPAYGDLDARFPACVVDMKVPAENLSKKGGKVTCETCQNIANLG